MTRKGLGRGLDALIKSDISEQNGILEIRINEIEPNMHQPRKNFDDEKLMQLAESIKIHGVVQPIIVRKENDIYRIVAGERRWRAAKIAGLTTIPVIVKELSNKELMEIALIENIQREDLNPLEEAEAYDKLIKEYNMTQEDISSAVGKSRSAIANTLRLLNLSEKVKSYIISGQLSNGHARTLVTIDDENLQIKLAEEIINKNLNVREAENLVKKINNVNNKKEGKSVNEEIIALEEKLKSIFGTKVRIISSKKRGKIQIEYYSNDELERILNLITSISDKF